MPKMTPDRDDRQGNMAGQGGPQDGPIGNPDRRQQQDQGSATPSDTGGAGSQRHRGGSSRDAQQQG